MPFDKQKFSFPWDWMVVIVSLVGANLIVKSQVNTNWRIHSFVYKAVELSKRNMEKKPDIDILILGDSRSEKINDQVLQSSLHPLSMEIQNASTNSGSWVSCYSLLRMVANDLSEDATTTLCVSEYWLEQPAYQTRAGILPAHLDYLALGEPVLSLTSLFPLSAKRGQIVNRIRAWAEAPFNKEANNSESSDDLHEGMDKSNLDLWLAPITKQQLADNFAFANHVLKEIRDLTPNLVLVYLPNANLREAYVEKHFPERRERFLANIVRLAEKHEIAFINLSQKLGDDALYTDFHHWNKKGVKAGTELLGEKLAPLLAK